jgi:hypothetical protein
MNNMKIILAWTSASAPKMIDFDDTNISNPELKPALQVAQKQ